MTRWLSWQSGEHHYPRTSRICCNLCHSRQVTPVTKRAVVVM